MVTSLLDLLVPSRCVGCARAGPPLCPECRPVAPLPVRVAHGGYGSLACRAAGRYRGPLRTAVVHYKERQHRALAGALGTLLAGAVLDLLGGAPGAPVVLRGGAPGGQIVLVPVPSSAAAVRARGDDHTRRLASVAAATLRRLGTDAVAARWLRPAHRVAESVGLSAAERRANLAGAFRATGGHHGDDRPVIVIDDVVTTGATLQEAARALFAAGVAVTGAAVVAATGRRG